MRQLALASVITLSVLGCGTSGEGGPASGTSQAASGKGESRDAAAGADQREVRAESGAEEESAARQVELAPGETAFPTIVGVPIPGAPTLAQPVIVMGATRPVLTEKHGLAAPAVFDWNRDGKKDLLVGEFETGDDESNIRVYLNIGTDDKPRFGDDFVYAKDTEGNRLSVPQW